MRVVLWMPRASEIPGGHRVQLESTARALRSLGVNVLESQEPELPDHRVDLVHGFGLGMHSGHVEAVRRAGLPVVISPIYWGLRYHSGGPDARVTAREWAGRCWRAGRYGQASLRGTGSLAQLSLRELHHELDRLRAWSAADVVLVNAEGERTQILDDLGIRTEIRVVPNGVDPGHFSPVHGVERRPRSALFVGRIEPHKNQLGLIRALADTDVHLTLVGPAHPHHPEYLQACQHAAAASGGVDIVGAVPHHELSRYYSAATTHVLPTWFETTGLVSLEAALCGCTVVTTSRGHAREYFENDAWYCDPASEGSVRSAVLAAVDEEASSDLAERILARFTWEQAAQHTLAAYEYILRRRRHSDLPSGAGRP